MNLVTNSTLSKSGAEFIVLIFAISLIYFWSPLFAWFGLSLVLGTLCQNAPAFIRRVLGLLLIIFIATVVASRQFGVSPSDDFAGSYYPVFIQIAHGNRDALFEYGQGIEVGLPFLWLLISFFQPDISSTGLIFLTTFMSMGIFWVWLEVYGLEGIDNQNRATVIAIVLLMCSFFLSSQLVRQFFSSVILLFAISGKNLSTRIIFLIIASFFHLTAFPIYIFFHLAKRPRLAFFLFVPIGILFVLGWRKFVDFVLAHQYFPGFEKALYVLTNSESFTDLDLSSGRYLVIVCLLIVFALLYEKSRDETRTQWRSILLTTAFLYGIFLVIPQFSLRSTLLISQILIGWLLVQALPSTSWLFIRIFFVVILIKKMLSLIAPPTDGMGFWGQFHYWGIYPGYFF